MARGRRGRRRAGTTGALDRRAQDGAAEGMALEEELNAHPELAHPRR